MLFDKKLLDIVACPVCKGKLTLTKDGTALVCKFDRLSFPIKDGIPVLLESDATPVSSEDLEALD